MKTPHQVNLSCTFCGKPQKEVRKLIAGPGLNICDRCVDRCGVFLGGALPELPSELQAELSALDSALATMGLRARLVNER